MKSLLKNRTSNRKARKAGFMPQLDALEERLCATVSVTTLDAGHTLRIDGDAGVNQVRIQQGDSFDQISIRTDNEDFTGGEDLIVDGQLVAGHNAVFTSSQITKLDIDLGGEADRFSYKLTGQSDFTNAKTVNLNLGAGANTAVLDFFDGNSTGPAHPPATLRAMLTLNIAGGANGDTVTTRFGAIDSATVNVTASLRGGTDFFSADLWGDLRHATADFRVNGGLGRDRLFVTAEDDFVNLDDSGIDLNSSLLSVNLQGDEFFSLLPGRFNQDTVNFTYEGDILNSKLVGRLDGQYGKDTVGASITTRQGGSNTIDVRVAGGVGNDTLTLLKTGAMTAVIDGGTGTDAAQASAGVTIQNVP
jgi:hypothetical protein